VTGGGTRRGAVAAHFAYISRRGTLEIETDEGERIGRREEQKRLLDDWHLELTAGQYRWQMDGGPARRDDATPFLRFKEQQSQLSPVGPAKGNPKGQERTLKRLFEPGCYDEQHRNKAKK
jgi:hypothetical protein